MSWRTFHRTSRATSLSAPISTCTRLRRFKGIIPGVTGRPTMLETASAIAATVSNPSRLSGRNEIRASKGAVYGSRLSPVPFLG
jgi:hypothetical protein